MKFKKGSAEAKRFMAKLRAQRGKKKKLSGEKESEAIHKYLRDRNQRLTHGYHTQPNNTLVAEKQKAKEYRSRIKKAYKKVKAYKEPKKSKLSGVHKDTQSHNVKISVLSGDMYSVRDRIEKELQRAINQLEILKHKKRNREQLDSFSKGLFKKYPKYIKSLKAQLRAQNSLITQNLK